MGLVYVPTGTKIMVGFSFPRHPVVFSDNDEGMFINTSETHVPWSKVAILGMVIPTLIGILIMGPYKPLLLG